MAAARDATGHAPGLTRRRAIAHGLSGAAGIALATVERRSTSARWMSTPAASPAPSSAYARPETLVDAATLVAHAGDPALTLLALMPADEFAAGHIPGSVQLDWPQLEITDTSDASVARWQAAMADLFASLGGQTVVTYDGGSLFATRPWWLLHYLGYDAVHVLNGGLPAWRAAGGAVESVTSSAEATPAATPQGSPVVSAAPGPRSDALATLADVQAALDDPGVVFVDARTPEEYAAGHIPGAVNINYPRNAAPDPPHVWLPPDALLAMYAEAGATPDKRVIPYCTTGVRSSVTYFTLYVLGYDNVRLFTGSWAEWSRHPELPVTRGNAP